MSIISRCIATIHDEIPEEILNEAFVTPYRDNYFSPVSVDSRIMDEVVNKRVMPDMDITYALTMRIPLSECKVERINAIDYQITIPEKAVNGRTIVSVLGVHAANPSAQYGYQDVTFTGGSSILGVAQKLASANAVATIDYNAKVQAIGPNVYRLRYASFLNSYATLELIVGHDKNLSNIPIRVTPYLKELFLLATKAYIYKKLKIKIDRAVQSGGADLASFSEFVDSYADANEMYKEYLRETIQAVGYMADDEGFHDLMKIQFGNGF